VRCAQRFEDVVSFKAQSEHAQLRRSVALAEASECVFGLLRTALVPRRSSTRLLRNNAHVAVCCAALAGTTATFTDPSSNPHLDLAAAALAKLRGDAAVRHVPHHFKDLLKRLATFNLI
jgi:hypothetical protein